MFVVVVVIVILYIPLRYANLFLNLLIYIIEMKWTFVYDTNKSNVSYIIYKNIGAMPQLAIPHRIYIIKSYRNKKWKPYYITYIYNLITYIYVLYMYIIICQFPLEKLSRKQKLKSFSILRIYLYIIYRYVYLYMCVY